MRMRGAIAGLCLSAGLLGFATGCATKSDKSGTPASAAETVDAGASNGASDGASDGALSGGAGLGTAGKGTPTAGATPGSTPAAAAKAPGQSYAVGVAQYTFTRAGRTLRTLVFYPAAGAAGGAVKSNAAVAAGRFPVVLWSHGLHGSPEAYQGVTAKIAAAGFVVAAPAYPGTNDKANPFNQSDMVNQPADASAVITEVVALDGKAPFAGHIDTGKVGAGGHSAGGYTTAGMLSGSTRDSRLKGAVIVSGGSLGGKFSGASTPVLFIHGDLDGTVPYSTGRSLYDSCPWPKAFLTLIGGDHGAALFGSGAANQAVSKEMLDFYRYTLYGDTSAKARLRPDATVAGATKYDGTL